MLIPNWRDGWRMWSIRFCFLSLLVEAADLANMLLPLWNMLPDDVAEMIPPSTSRFVGLVLLGLSLFSRIIAQPKLQRLRNGRDEEAR